ncbi:hypothetical protein [Nitriliruptor alkaliphilus]|uniref:hypothetical protein n=1 Tax=Nitriliruptor alkaliphilus TaxID=427918 RepID=UPI000697847A|nr:hypothetical protein [Nitriliruptor alkaliphilus]
MTRTIDPTVRAIEDALAFATAAVAGDVETAMTTAWDALRDDQQLFLDALVSTVQLLADEALDGGVDVRDVLRDVALGVQVAHLAESVAEHHHPTDHPPETRS